MAAPRCEDATKVIADVDMPSRYRMSNAHLSRQLHKPFVPFHPIVWSPFVEGLLLGAPTRPQLILGDWMVFFFW